MAGTGARFLGDSNANLVDDVPAGVQQDQAQFGAIITAKRLISQHIAMVSNA